VPVNASRTISPSRVLSAQRLMTGAIAGLAKYPIYALDFPGESEYAVVEPFTVYGWSEITIEELIYPVWPKANTAWSKFSMIGDRWTDYPSTYLGTNGKYDYTVLSVSWFVRKPSGTTEGYSYDMINYVNQWVHVIRRFTEDREFSVWINGEKKYSAAVPEDYATVLEWNPDTATHPEYYRRFVLGASVEFEEFMTVKYGYLRIYKDKALTADEIQHNKENPMTPITDGLVLWLDARKVVNDLWPDLSGYGNDGTIYGAEWIAVDKPSAETEIITGWNARISGHEYVSTVRPAARVIPCSR